MSQDSTQGVPEYSAPVTVFLNLTQQCNLRCIYCAAEVVRPSKESGELSDEEMLALVDRLIEARVFRYALTGGEPFVRRSLVYGILDRVAGRGHLMLYTNGTLLTRQDAARLAAVPGRMAVFLSIDAPDEEVNAVARGRHVLAKTLRAARYLLEAGIKPKINCVVRRDNAPVIRRLAALLKEHGLAELHLINLQPVGYASGLLGMALDETMRRELWDELVDLAASEPEMRIVSGDIDNWEGYDSALARYRTQGARPRGLEAKLLPCSAGIDQCAITADGWLVPCNFMFGYHCGNVRQQDVLDIWQRSRPLHSFRALRSMPVTTVTECAGCKYNVFCNGGCRALALAGSGNLLGCDPTCPYREPVAEAATRAQLPVVV